MRRSTEPEEVAPEAPIPDAVHTLQRSAGNQAVARLIGSAGDAAHEGPLPGGVRAEMEGAFGRSFADVRIHQGGVAETRGALALTARNDIHFARGHFAPDTPHGRFLLAHELAHVVQQAGSKAKPTGDPPPKLADPALDREADAAGARAAAREPVADLRLTPLRAPLPVSQHFEESEHKKIGDLATAGPLGETKMVELAPDYRVTYGEMVAMGGDHFESIDQMRDMAQNAGRGAGTREEIEYVRTVKINGNKAAESSFSDEARKAADQRYYRLAADNPSHFLAPDAGDQDRPIGERAGDTAFSGFRLTSLFPLVIEEVRAPMNAVAGYHMNHARAVVEAATAAQAGAPIDQALATEAFGNHYLTDCFSGGHVRTARRSAFEYWNEKVPMFGYNLQGYLAQKIAEELNDSLSIYSVEGFYSGGLPWNAEGTFKTVGRALSGKGAAVTFGHVVAGSIHDFDNEVGVRAIAGGEEVLLKGDSHLGEGDEERLAVAAVTASVAEVEAAYRLARAGVAPEDLPGALTVPYADGLFAAERLLPKAVPDEEQLLRTDATMSVPWEFPSYDKLLQDGRFAPALEKFCAKKAGELTDLVKDERKEARDAVENIATRLRGGQGAQVVKEVIEWVPDTGGKLFGRLEDDNAMDYIDKATKTQGGLASLAVPQRVKLIRFLFSGITFGDEEDAAFSVLTANPADTQAVINEVGWDELEDELGDRFSDAFPRP